MPLFDYRCLECSKRFSLLVGVVAEKQAEKCPACGSEKINRLISRFGRVRSEDDLMDDLADPDRMGDIEDPKQMKQWMKRMGREMGEELGGDFDEMMEEMEAAEAGEPGAGLEGEPPAGMCE